MYEEESEDVALVFSLCQAERQRAVLVPVLEKKNGGGDRKDKVLACFFYTLPVLGSEKSGWSIKIVPGAVQSAAKPCRKDLQPMK